MNEERNVSERAAELLLSQTEEVKKKYEKATNVECRIKVLLADAIGRTLMRFCYQDEEFATAIERSGKTLSEVVDEVAKRVTRDKPALSDSEAYALAVKCYLPAAEISVSMRVILPEERDSDLLLLGREEEGSENAERTAMILDLFGTGEV